MNATDEDMNRDLVKHRAKLANDRNGPEDVPVSVQQIIYPP